VVDSHFSPDGRVHLRQERRWHLKQPHAAVKRRRDEATEVTHHAASARHEEVAAPEAGLDEASPEHLGRGHRLAGFARDDAQHLRRIAGRLEIQE